MTSLFERRFYPARLVHNARYFFASLRQAFAQASALRPYERQVLGHAGGHDIVLFTPRDPDPDAKNILIAAGFHGEEPAGPWGICRYLAEAGAEDLKGVNISFLPLVNPTGFDRNNRYNDDGQNPNSGFGPRAADENPSAEGEILLRHDARLFHAARDGFLTLHEDIGVEGGYLWDYEAGKTAPGPFACALQSVIARHFNLLAQSRIEHGGYNVAVTDGIVFVRPEDNDDTYESYLHTEGGVPVGATTETPVGAPVEKRIACHRDLIRAFVDYMRVPHP